MILFLNEEIMTKTLKIILAGATLLTTLATLGLTVFALTIPHWGLFATCLALTLMFGLFVRNDYAYFFGKKNDAGK
jgi:hypothetical protein